MKGKTLHSKKVTRQNGEQVLSRYESPQLECYRYKNAWFFSLWCKKQKKSEWDLCFGLTIKVVTFAILACDERE